MFFFKNVDLIRIISYLKKKKLNKNRTIHYSRDGTAARCSLSLLWSTMLDLINCKMASFFFLLKPFMLKKKNISTNILTNKDKRVNMVVNITFHYPIAPVTG